MGVGFPFLLYRSWRLNSGLAQEVTLPAEPSCWLLSRGFGGPLLETHCLQPRKSRGILYELLDCLFSGGGVFMKGSNLVAQDNLELILQPNLVSAALPPSPEFWDHTCAAPCCLHLLSSGITHVKHHADCLIMCFRDPKGILEGGGVLWVVCSVPSPAGRSPITRDWPCLTRGLDQLKDCPAAHLETQSTGN